MSTLSHTTINFKPSNTILRHVISMRRSCRGISPTVHVSDSLRVFAQGLRTRIRQDYHQHFCFDFHIASSMLQESSWPPATFLFCPDFVLRFASFASKPLQATVFSTLFKTCRRHPAASLLRPHYPARAKTRLLTSLTGKGRMMQPTLSTGPAARDGRISS